MSTPILNRLRLLALVIFAICLPSCATVVRGTRQKLVVESNPPGASVRLHNGTVGTTPTTFWVKRRENTVLTVTKPGYKMAIINIRSQYAPMGVANSAGNIILGGVVGVVIDAVSGSLKSIEPNRAQVTLIRGKDW